MPPEPPWTCGFQKLPISHPPPTNNIPSKITAMWGAFTKVVYGFAGGGAGVRARAGHAHGIGMSAAAARGMLGEPTTQSSATYSTRKRFAIKNCDLVCPVPRNGVYQIPVFDCRTISGALCDRALGGGST
jgi:hypothetical protein